MRAGYCEGGQTMSAQTQNQKLLEYLKRGGKVTRWNALLDLGIANITARITDLRGKPRPKRPDLRSKSLGGADRFGRGWIARTPGPARCRLRCSVLVSSVRAASEALTALPNQPYPKGVAVTESTVEQELPLVLSVACREVSLFFPCRIFRDSLNGCKSVLFVIQ